LPAIWLAFLDPALAATLDVCDTCAHTTVGSAVAASTPGDTIRVAAGTYVESGLTLNDTVVIEGAGSGLTVLQSASAEVVSVRGGTVEISGVELDNTQSGRGVAVSGGYLTLRDVLVADQTGTDDGLGVYHTGGRLVIEDSTFRDLSTTGRGAALYSSASGPASARSTYSGCSSSEGGAVYATSGFRAADDTFVSNTSAGHGGAIGMATGGGVELTGCTLTDNAADPTSGYGGAISTDSTVSVTESTFAGNSAAVAGDVSGGWLALSESTITGSTAATCGSLASTDNLHLSEVTVSGVVTTDAGAAVCIFDAQARTSIFSDVVFEDNEGVEGGHVYAYASALDVHDATFTGGVAVTGGAVYVDDGARRYGFTCDTCELSGNAAGSGGAIAAYDTEVELTDCELADNAARTGDGGALLVSGGNTAIDGVTFADNAAARDGGAIATEGNGLVVTDSRFERNRAAGAGGGLYGTSTVALSVSGSTFCENEATRGGGAYSAEQPMAGAFVWEDVAFVENEASAEGGGLWAGMGATVQQASFLGNGAGALYTAGDLSLTSTLIAYTTSGDGLYGTGTTSASVIGHNAFWSNLDDDVSGSFSTPDSTNLAVEPQLADYAVGDGCDAVLYLDLASPLIDAGDPSQRDEDGTRADIGVDEYDCDTPVTGWADEDGDGYGEDGFGITTCSTAVSSVSGDCDDGDAAVNPAAADADCDGVDDDCDGAADDGSPTTTWYADRDGDGQGDATDALTTCETPADYVTDASDCDDADGSVHVGAAEITADGIDQDCDGGDACHTDADGDRWGVVDPVSSADMDCDDPGESVNALDCDDRSALVSPAADEIEGDGVDNDCDGLADEDGGEDTDPEDTDTGEPADTDTGEDTDAGDTDTDAPDDTDDSDEGRPPRSDDGRAMGGNGCACDGSGGRAGAWPLLMLALLARRRSGR
jgi:predicted outer membrane repeat protein